MGLVAILASVILYITICLKYIAFDVAIDIVDDLFVHTGKNCQSTLMDNRMEFRNFPVVISINGIVKQITLWEIMFL